MILMVFPFKDFCHLICKTIQFDRSISNYYHNYTNIHYKIDKKQLTLKLAVVLSQYLYHKLERA